MKRHEIKSKPAQNIEDMVSRLFGSSADIKKRTVLLPAQGYSVQLVYCQGLSDTAKVEQNVIPELKNIPEQMLLSDEMDLPLKVPFQMEPIPQDRTEEGMKTTVLAGDLLLIFAPSNRCYSMVMGNAPKRQPEEPNTEVSTRGPRDGFVEDSYTNIALIRRRLKTDQLAVEEFTIGSETATQIHLLYHKATIKDDVLQEIRARLSRIKTKGLVSNSQLEEMLTGGLLVFPLMTYSGRPDYAVNSLLHGKFVIVMDGAPTVLIAPVNINFLINSSEDAFLVNVVVAFTRFLRGIGVLLSLFLPGFWIALNTYHQDQIPFTLLATLVNSRQGVPLPAPLEAMVMLFLFEIFREAGMRLPSAFGQTLSVVGGLIIGQAAMSAGIAGPGTIVVIAISVLSTFTLVNQSLVNIVGLFRIFVLLISSILGLFGVLFSLLAMVLFLVNLRSFGTYYLAPLSPPKFREMYKVLFRMPWGKGGFTGGKGNKG